MTQKQKEICESLDWYVGECEDDIELEKYSPAGEDFIFCADKDNFVESVTEYANDFDADDHAKEWIINMGTTRGVPQSVRELIDDADAIKELLIELANALQNEED